VHDAKTNETAQMMNMFLFMVIIFYSQNSQNLQNVFLTATNRVAFGKQACWLLPPTVRMVL